MHIKPFQRFFLLKYIHTFIYYHEVILLVLMKRKHSLFHFEYTYVCKHSRLFLNNRPYTLKKKEKKRKIPKRTKNHKHLFAKALTFFVELNLL